MDEAAPQAACTDDTTLGEVAFHWGDAYDISGDPLRGYTARRRDGKGEPLTSASPRDLWDDIKADYAREPVSHEFDPQPRL